MFRRTFPSPTPKQQARQDRARRLGCIACIERGTNVGCGPPEIHHLTTMGRQTGEDNTVCLGSWHHRGIVLPGMTSSQMTEKFGPSLAKGSKPFYAVFGRNEKLLAKQECYLGNFYGS